MANKLEICNYALSLVGEQVLTSIDEAKKPAIVCKLYFDQVLDTVLQSHSWNCAIERATISSDITAPLYGYDYKLLLPTDPYCLRVLEVENNDYINWEIEGRYLLCDESEVNIKYIKRVTDLSELDPLCVTALYYSLAIQICIPLMKDASFRNRLVDELNAFINQTAKSINSMENNKTASSGDWYNSRYSGNMLI